MNPPNERMSKRIESAQEILKAYALMRAKLTPAEQPHFDKVVQLIEELAEAPESSKLLALDSALATSLFVVNGNEALCSAVIHGLTRLAHQVALLSALGGIIRGRRNSN